MGTRLDFTSTDAAGFNVLRDEWRDFASGRKLPKIAIRIASILPKYVNREEGYCFPSDELIANALNTSTRNVGKGMAALEAADLIERQTMVKRDDKREAVGRLRRIFLTMPRDRGERNTFASEVKGTPPEVNGTNWGGERNDVFRITPDKRTLDKEDIRIERRLGTTRIPAREGEPPVYRGDTEFLDAFDQKLMELTDGKPIGAGEFEHIVQQAFDKTTDSSDDFMPVLWQEIAALRTGEITAWFLRRAGQLIHRKVAA